MTGSDFDWMVSNHAVWGWKAPEKASVSGVSLLQLSPFFTSTFPLFLQKCLILRQFKFLHVLLLPFVLRWNCNYLDCVDYPRQVVLHFSYYHNSV